jgi:hypothetical protein
MNIQDYYRKLNESCQKIFESTLTTNVELFSKVHHFSTCLFEFSESLNDKQESDLLKVVCSQLEISALNASFGLYRQAFTSMRLGLEMGLGIVYFSAFKLEQYEWLSGKTDIKWSKIIDKENGVLSKRFANAFFPELIQSAEEYNHLASAIYRQLSEFVHGNYETWESSGLILLKNDVLIDEYFEYFLKVKDILLFSLCFRHLKMLPIEKIDLMTFILEELGHNKSIRLFIESL